MSSVTVQVLGYQLPTVLPSPPGVCGVADGAPRAVLQENDPQVRAQRLLNVIAWAQATLRPSSKALKVFVAPEATFRRFVPSPTDPTTFDPNAGLGHYPPGTSATILSALHAALAADTTWDDWLVVVGAEEWLDARQNLVASDLLLVGTKDREPVLLREVVDPLTDRPYTVQQALAGDLPRGRVVGPRFALESYQRVQGALLGFETTLGHGAGLLRKSLQGLARALGQDPNPALQVLCSVDRDLDPAEIVAAVGGYAVVNDGMFARDNNDALALDVPPRIALSEVSAYNDSIAQLTEQKPQSDKPVPDAYQVQVPLPGYTARQSVTLYRPVTVKV